MNKLGDRGPRPHFLNFKVAITFFYFESEVTMIKSDDPSVRLEPTFQHTESTTKYNGS